MTSLRSSAIDVGDQAGPGIFEGIHLRKIAVVDKQNPDGGAHGDGEPKKDEEYKRAKVSFKVPLHPAIITPCHFSRIRSSIRLRGMGHPL